MRVRELRAEELAGYGRMLAELEHRIEYPLGEDRFRIDHGLDYFAFFRRLGELTYFVAEEGGALAGALAAVRRTRPAAWYVCDLKAVRGTCRRFVAGALVRAFAARHGRGDAAGYGISMDPPSGPNRVARMSVRRIGMGLEAGPRLTLFSLDEERMLCFAPVLRARHGAIGYLDLGGLKDIVLRSTGRPMPLLHVQFGPCGAGDPAIEGPRAGAAHMFCIPDGDGLLDEAAAAGLVPCGRATIVQRRMSPRDWSFVLTSDI